MKKRLFLIAFIVGLFSFLPTMSYAYNTVVIKGKASIATKDCKIVPGKEKTFSWAGKAGCTLDLLYDVKKQHCTVRVYTEQAPSYLACPASTVVQQNGEEIVVDLKN